MKAISSISIRLLIIAILMITTKMSIANDTLIDEVAPAGAMTIEQTLSEEGQKNTISFSAIIIL